MKKILLTLLIPMLFLAACNDENDNYQLGFATSKKFIGEKAWLVVNNYGDRELIDFVELKPGTPYISPETRSFKVNTTIINQTEEVDGRKKYYLTSYVSLPTRHWLLKGGDVMPKPAGYAEVNVYNVPMVSEEVVVSTRLQHFTESSVEGDVSFEFPVRTLDSQNKFNLLATAINNQSMEGRYSWLLNQDFSIGGSNAYNVVLERDMIKKQVKSSIPLDFAEVYSFESTLQGFGNIYKHYEVEFNAGQTSFPLLYADLPTDQYYFFSAGYNIGSRQNIHRHYYVSEIPDLVNVSNTTISGNYSPSDQTIENIRVNGQVSYLGAVYRYETDEAVFIWDLYFPKHYTSFYLPTLPDALNELTGIDVKQFRPDFLLSYRPERINNLREYYNRWLGREGINPFGEYIEEAVYKFDVK